MKDNYFERLNKTSTTRMWINNPSINEAKLALEQGAVCCTTNPAYCSRLLKADKQFLDDIIDQFLDESLPAKEFDFDNAARVVYQRATKQIMELFMPLYTKPDGQYGFVTIQDDPRYDHDAEFVIKWILSNRKLSPNYMAKIPVIKGGIEAIEECVKLNIPSCATEVFAVSQAVDMCERYTAACKKYGNHPAMYITHISGIFDEYLEKKAKLNGIEISEEVLKQAGVTVARKEYQVLKEKGYNFTLLGGGARGIHHFSEIVGGPHITINWSTAVDLIDADLPIENTILKKTDQKVIDELSEKFVEFRRAYNENGLALEDYANFGPVQYFRNAFIKGWHLLLAEIADRRNAKAI